MRNNQMPSTGTPSLDLPQKIDLYAICSPLLQFVDRARVFVKAGTGGQGSKTRGSNGGDGGDVYCTASRHCTSLVSEGRWAGITTCTPAFCDPTCSLFAPPQSRLTFHAVLPMLSASRLPSCPASGTQRHSADHRLTWPRGSAGRCSK